jgi:hypothetical protein
MILLQQLADMRLHRRRVAFATEGFPQQGSLA